MAIVAGLSFPCASLLLDCVVGADYTQGGFESRLCNGVQGRLEVSEAAGVEGIDSSLGTFRVAWPHVTLTCFEGSTTTTLSRNGIDCHRHVTSLKTGYHGLGKEERSGCDL